MSVLQRLTTTVSTKGQVVLPKAIRQALRWEAGTRLVVENTPDGVLLKPAPVFVETRPGEVFGRLSCDGTPKSLAEMEAGVLAEAQRRHAGGRYQYRRPLPDRRRSGAKRRGENRDRGGTGFRRRDRFS